MKKTRRSAFTIVELVIVIAVIAILSAVLIPTFGMIIRDANEAADNSTAATLTSELHVYLKGEQIDSEEELMDVLSDAKSGIGKKLVPKALAWGNHFWFDIANQRFIAATADEVSTYEPSEQALTQPTEGPALMAAVTLAARNSSALAGMRDIYQNGYFL
ncbi:MAG: type II secretion system protein, partial [Oscillospiraceae bacterium]|nr:type II secretion system protein [Oscillospiraceae bacterium]